MSVATGRDGARLEVEGLAVGYRSRRGLIPVVEDVSFVHDPGEALGIVGESGCGKSTVALALAGLLRPDEAAVSARTLRFAGIDLRRMDERARQQLLGRRIGFVFQNPHVALNPVLSVARQMTDHIRWHLGLTGADARARATSLLEEVGIADAQHRLNMFPHEFSGGMLQRITIAIALACDPELLIADEPTTALDASVQADIVELVGSIRAKRGLGMIWITHDLALLRGIADRVAVMYAGRVVEYGPTAPLYARPRHPYTAALLASVRSLWQEDSGPFRAIEGAPPPPGKRPPGCAFRPRCPSVFDRCVTRPDLLPVGERHVSCWAVAGQGSDP